MTENATGSKRFTSNPSVAGSAKRKWSENILMPSALWGFKRLKADQAKLGVTETDLRSSLVKQPLNWPRSLSLEEELLEDKSLERLLEKTLTISGSLWMPSTTGAWGSRWEHDLLMSFQKLCELVLARALAIHLLLICDMHVCVYMYVCVLRVCVCVCMCWVWLLYMYIRREVLHWMIEAHCYNNSWNKTRFWANDITNFIRQSRSFRLRRSSSAAQLKSFAQKVSYSNKCYNHGCIFLRVILMTRSISLNLVPQQQLHTQPNKRKSTTALKMAHIHSK